MKYVLTVFVVLIALPFSASAKSRPTYYTKERVKIARENVERYDWAQAKLKRIKNILRDNFSVF